MMVATCDTSHASGKVFLHLTHFEGVIFNGFDDIFEEHFGCEGVAVINDRLSIASVPAVELDTPATLHQRSVRRENIGDHLTGDNKTLSVHEP